MRVKSAEREPACVHRIRIGISSCLLGHRTRYDGSHKRDRYITDRLGRLFEWIAVCPEVELGLGTPREPIRLEQLEGGIRLLAHDSGRDLTDSMRAYAVRRLEELSAENLCGYVLKSDSPSCGLETVPVHRRTRAPTRTGRGLFAEALLVRFPHLPVEEEAGLRDPGIRENWIERVLAFARLQKLWNSRWTVQSLTEFQAAAKLTVLSHSPAAYESLGRLVARAGTISRQELQTRYHSEFMESLKTPATRGRHANVLQHMAGYFKRQLDSESRQKLVGTIDGYRKGKSRLIVPVTLVARNVRRFDISYLAKQTYLDDHTKIASVI